MLEYWNNGSKNKIEYKRQETELPAVGRRRSVVSYNEYWNIGIMEESARYKVQGAGRTEKQKGRGTITKTRSLPAVNLAGYESTKEEGVI